MTVSHGKPYAGKPHVRFDEGAGVPGKGRSALLHEYEWWSRSVNGSRRWRGERVQKDGGAGIACGTRIHFAYNSDTII